ncbi:MAG: protocatechuate 3,4-dioxygenase beta subunit [Verrucomicrobiales bacterium]
MRRFAPAFAAQLASSFANRVTPARVGGVATNIRYFQKRGIPTAVSVTAVGLNAVAGLIMHVGLTLTFLLLSGGNRESGGVPVPSPKWVGFGFGAAVAIIGLSLAVPFTRTLVMERVAPQLRAGWDSMQQIGKSPGRIALLFGGSAAITLAYLAAMAASLDAFGSTVSLPVVGLFYLTGSALANAAPTPGGLGGVPVPFRDVLATNSSRLAGIELPATKRPDPSRTLPVSRASIPPRDDAMTQHNITPEEHLRNVLSSYDDSTNARLHEITTSLIKHLHEFVAEVGLTREEWFAGMQGLTRTGEMCTAERQEFILLSDTIGVSMLIEMINHQAEAGSTEPTVFGPFHVDNAPRKEMGGSIVIDPSDLDEPVVYHGTVRDLDGNPIEGAEPDVWCTASNGFYDVQDPSQTPLNMRGIFTTGADGSYEIMAVRPVAYTIPGDGPAGELLFENGRHSWRPAHMHFVVSAEGQKTVITHLFDSESDYLDSDAVFGVRDSLIADMTGRRCEYDFVLAEAT